MNFRSLQNSKINIHQWILFLHSENVQSENKTKTFPIASTSEILMDKYDSQDACTEN